MLASEPRAALASFHPATGRVTIELVNGCAYLFPARMVEDLAGASAGDHSEIVVNGQAFNLFWPRLDANVYVPALVAGVFGIASWMNKALARHAGEATSAAKSAAARANGRLGGRPRKHA
jgi:Protein of unknown function (DUF2442)